MSALDVFRRELRARLGTAVMLRRDQAARALFICDAPRRRNDCPALAEELRQLGYAVLPDRGLWRIDLSPARQAAWIESLSPRSLPLAPAWRSLCRSLLSQGIPEAARQPWPPIRLTLLRLDAGENARLYEELCATAAICKRTHAPLPAAAAYLIEETDIKEGPPC